MKLDDAMCLDSGTSKGTVRVSKKCPGDLLEASVAGLLASIWPEGLNSPVAHK